MATILFDFDSTLISEESLDAILSHNADQAMREALKATTAQGMGGEIPFHVSLQRRLQLVVPRKRDVAEYGKGAIKLLTPGMEPLIAELRDRDHDVWIVSGGLMEAIMPTAEFLGLDESHVRAVQLLWDADGLFAGIDPADPFSTSKIAGARIVASNWKAPVVGIGDGMTDFELYKEGLVEYFIAFVQHARRPALIDVTPHVANDVKELKALLEVLV